MHRRDTSDEAGPSGRPPVGAAAPVSLAEGFPFVSARQHTVVCVDGDGGLAVAPAPAAPPRGQVWGRPSASTLLRPPLAPDRPDDHGDVLAPLRRTGRGVKHCASEPGGLDTEDVQRRLTYQAEKKARPPSGRKGVRTMHHSRHASFDLHDVDMLGCRCSVKIPRTDVLFRLFMMLVLLLSVLNATTCGFVVFVCRPLPDGRRYNTFVRDLFEGTSLQRANGQLSGKAESVRLSERPEVDTPPLIPRLIHQTFKTKDVPSRVKPLLQSWSTANPGHETRFYDNQACLQFVEREFPEYLQAYKLLPKDVERSDFFRYMVILRLGGVYADVDTECRQPIDQLIRPTDTLVAGWEAAWDSDDIAFQRHFVRRRQVLNWVFAAAPGHPVLREVCERINHHSLSTFSNFTNRDTLERTGPGVWTDVVLRYAFQKTQASESNRQDPWGVRILPRVAFGTHPSDPEGFPGWEKRVLVAHQFLGTWKQRGSGWRTISSQPSLEWYHWWRRAKLWFEEAFIRGRALENAHAELDRAGTEVRQRLNQPDMDVFPVSVTWDPPFDILARLNGGVEDHTRTGEDMSGAITHWGVWQAGVDPTRSPGVAEALVGSLGGFNRSAALIDIGAGIGYFSLAAAARGHSVHAFEWVKSDYDLFKRSVIYNRFGGLVKVHNHAVGVDDPAFCKAWRATGGKSLVPLVNYAGAAAAQVAALRVDTLPLSGWWKWGPWNGDNEATDDADEDSDVEAEDDKTSVERDGRGRRLAHSLLEERGAGNDPVIVEADAEAVPVVSDVGQACEMPDGMKSLDDIITSVKDVGAIRLSSGGWEGWMLKGAERLMSEAPPPIVIIEFNAWAVERSGFGAMRLLEQMYAWGYTDMSHSGHVCDERWSNITRGIPRIPVGTAPLSVALRQPTWCRLHREHFGLLLQNAHVMRPDNVLFHHPGKLPEVEDAKTNPTSLHQEAEADQEGRLAATGATPVPSLSAAEPPAGPDGAAAGDDEEESAAPRSAVDERPEEAE